MSKLAITLDCILKNIILLYLGQLSRRKYWMQHQPILDISPSTYQHYMTDSYKSYLEVSPIKNLKFLAKR